MRKSTLFGCFFISALLAATTVVVATATVVSIASATRAAAAEEDEDKNDYPRAVVSTEVTHFVSPLCLFSSHTMLIWGELLQIIFEDFKFLVVCVILCV